MYTSLKKLRVRVSLWTKGATTWCFLGSSHLLYDESSSILQNHPGEEQETFPMTNLVWFTFTFTYAFNACITTSDFEQLERVLKALALGFL